MSLRTRLHAYATRALLLLTIVVAPSLAAAEMYSWIDDDGKMHVTDDRAQVPVEKRRSARVDEDAMRKTQILPVEPSGPAAASPEQAPRARRIVYPAGVEGEHITVDIPGRWTDVAQGMFDRIDSLARQVHEEGGETALIAAIELLPRSDFDEYALFTITAMMGAKYTTAQLADFGSASVDDLAQPGIPFTFKRVRYDPVQNIIWADGVVRSRTGLSTLTAIIPTEVGALVFQGMTARPEHFVDTFQDMIESTRVSEALRYRPEQPKPQIVKTAAAPNPPAPAIPESGPEPRRSASPWGIFVGLLAAVILAITWGRLDQPSAPAARRTPKKLAAAVVAFVVMCLLVEDPLQAADAGQAFLYTLIAIVVLRGIARAIRRKPRSA